MLRSIRVAQVVDAMGVGGLENGVINLINGLPPQIQSTLLCMRAEGDMIQRLDSGRVDIACMHKKPGQDWGAIWRAAQQLRRWQVDIVHTRNWGGVDGILAAKLAGVRHIIHGEHGWAMDDMHGASRKRNWLRRRLSPWVSHYVALSHQIEGWMTGTIGLDPAKISVIHNGVDVQHFQPAEAALIRQTLGLDPSCFWIGTVARFDPIKDHLRLLQAFAQAHAQFPQARFLLVGDGPMRAAIEQQIADLQLGDVVHLPGAQREVRPWLQALDLFVLPSLNEGISNTILEAMACGLPVLATQVGGNPELVLDGDTGTLIPAADTAALAAALAAYLQSPTLAKTQGQAGRQRVQQHFALQRMVHQYATLYQRLPL